MPPALQAKLLHVLQDQEFSRLGSCARVKVNVRIVAATNVDIKAAIAAKTFREDLYYRLSGFVFSIPPLRERKEDIRLLFRHYVARYAESLGLPQRVITSEVWNTCARHSWPGNVRELENFAKRYLIFGEEGIEPAAFFKAAHHLAPGAYLHDGNLRANFRNKQPEDTAGSGEASAIARILEQTNWNRKQAARILNMSYKSILSKIRQYRLDQASSVTTMDIRPESRVSSTK